ncbi:uncharacterized protein BP5553_09115 [Venustampulla echinocandica]|uniref:Uncharacterized protein n=1 Tax=Venustampulla echinocandica TaxID=2656787 RepID=A0A370TDX2_9HELO|nr:uncharacterized protein BP5553_09115 [Venustampulla echinocandica]RDL32659.1 hypothetical protein BP5553_09115 [Venustampulla echinocandica]
MDSFPDSEPYARTANSTRNSYASTTGHSDRASNSSRSSYGSISELATVTSQKSNIFRTDGLDRISSFSRTAYSFSPSSVASSPQTLSPENDDPMNLPRDQGSRKEDGAQALKDPKEVQNIICVAFGAFDRYYMAWEDKDGQFHQESHKLPEKLHTWLFPPDGSTRNFETLQVSLGSNDEFFASDKFEKISSRDSSHPISTSESIEEVPPSARLTRTKAHTISSSIPEELLKRLDYKPATPKLERRKTDLFTRIDLKQETPRVQRRRSIIIGGAPIQHSWENKKALPRLRTQGTYQIDLERIKYVDVGVQTEDMHFGEREPPIAEFSYYGYVEPRNPVSIGSMQDFCRTHQYSLGDALRYV